MDETSATTIDIAPEAFIAQLKRMCFPQGMYILHVSDRGFIVKTMKVQVE